MSTESPYHSVIYYIKYLLKRPILPPVGSSGPRLIINYYIIYYILLYYYNYIIIIIFYIIIFIIYYIEEIYSSTNKLLKFEIFLARSNTSIALELLTIARNAQILSV